MHAKLPQSILAILADQEDSSQQDCQLLAQQQILEGQLTARAEQRNEKIHEKPEPIHLAETLNRQP